MDKANSTDTPPPPGANPVQTLSPTGDAYVDSCFFLGFTHCPDDRAWSRMDGLKEVPDLVKQNRLADAWSILDENQAVFHDFDFIYAWKSCILQKNDQVDAARKMLESGLTRARGKFLLCDRLGFLEYETGDLNKAVGWWIKSIVIMVRTGAVTMWEPFLYLAYVAEACGSKKHFNLLMAQVAKISVHGELLLETDTSAKLNEKASRLPAAPVLKAIDCLCREFLIHPADENRQSPVQPSMADLYPGNDTHTVFIKEKKLLWPVCLSIAGVFLIFLFIFIFFIKPAQQNPEDLNRTVPDQIRADITVSDEPPSPEAITQTAETKTETPPPPPPPRETVIDPIRHKEKGSYLKTKTKSPNPDIQMKEQPKERD